MERDGAGLNKFLPARAITTHFPNNQSVLRSPIQGDSLTPLVPPEWGEIRGASWSWLSNLDALGAIIWSHVTLSSDADRQVEDVVTAFR